MENIDVLPLDNQKLIWGLLFLIFHLMKGLGISLGWFFFIKRYLKFDPRWFGMFKFHIFTWKNSDNAAKALIKYEMSTMRRLPDTIISNNFNQLKLKLDLVRKWKRTRTFNVIVVPKGMQLVYYVFHKAFQLETIICELCVLFPY